MGLLDRLLGREEQPSRPAPGQASYGGQATTAGDQPLSDEQALARYRYMLRTAPPEAIEQAHEEAFAKLTPHQRAQVLEELSAATPERERGALSDDPKALARLATRAEMRQPGVMERTFARPGLGQGMGMGGLMGGSIFGSLVAGFVGSMIANQLFSSMGGFDFNNSDFADPGDPAAYPDGGPSEMVSDSGSFDGGGFDGGGFDGGGFDGGGFGDA